MRSPDLTTSLLDLAATHGLDLDPSTLTINEMGLDFRVALATTASSSATSPNDSAGERWVLRVPRRPDALKRAEVESRLLDLVGPQLSVAVPQWRVQATDLIAYPALPGEPGLTLDHDGAPLWHLDVTSERYARSLGAFLAELHAIDPADAAAAGVEVLPPDEVRTRWAQDMAQVAAEFQVSPALQDRWSAWLAEDSFWPAFSVVTHGEVYPAHTLVVDEEITAVLDWTTASVGDPARDFAIHHAVAPPEVFAATLEEYVRRGGRIWPRLGEHGAEIMAAGPVAYGLFALQSGVAEHRQAAQAQLNPETAAG
ncbi:macrolide 2'-phosphotransferase [Citricoccus sp.]|uniref:macrolide 2'-phosphotransferase n=1 Tax=Citricoccus sp. TaxID=1978372 RepID=UPI0028BD6B14|nr:macrolide 2'-phosphotransferase [Citricoccus sp.]